MPPAARLAAKAERTLTSGATSHSRKQRRPPGVAMKSTRAAQFTARSRAMRAAASRARIARRRSCTSSRRGAFADPTVAESAAARGAARRAWRAARRARARSRRLRRDGSTRAAARATARALRRAHYGLLPESQARGELLVHLILSAHV